MVINDALNLVLPIRIGDDGEPLLWAHHTPISAEVFRANYRIIAAANASIWSGGLKYASTSGARIANLALLDMGKTDAEDRGGENAAPALLAEIRRLTHVLAPGANGFEMLPVDVAIARNVIDQEDWSEAEGAITFFSLGFAMSKRAGRKSFCDLIALVIAGSTTSLAPLAYAASSLQSTPDAASTALPSSPSSLPG